MTLRPDELALQGDTQRSKEINQNIVGAASTVGSLALGAGAAKLGSKILPFLSDYIPANLALKGINKVAPKFGAFLSKGMEQGLDLKEGLNYLKENIANSTKKKEKGEENILQRYSPRMYQHIKDLVDRGQTPSMGMEDFLKKNKHFSEAVKKMEQETGKTKEQIAEESFKGMGKKSGQPQPSPQMQQEPMQQQTPQQGLKIDDKLEAMFDKIMNM